MDSVFLAEEVVVVAAVSGPVVLDEEVACGPVFLAEEVVMVATGGPVFLPEVCGVMAVVACGPVFLAEVVAGCGVMVVAVCGPTVWVACGIAAGGGVDGATRMDRSWKDCTGVGGVGFTVFL